MNVGQTRYTAELADHILDQLRGKKQELNRAG